MPCEVIAMLLRLMARGMRQRFLLLASFVGRCSPTRNAKSIFQDVASRLMSSPRIQQLYFEFDN